MPEEKNKHYLDENFPGWRESLCDDLNDHAVGSHVYSVELMDGGVVIFDQADSHCGILDTSEAMEGALRHVNVDLVMCMAELDRLERRTRWLVELKTAFEAGHRYGGFGTYAKYLTSSHWRKIRKSAVDRAGGRCMLCNRDEESLHVHHRTYERLGKEDPMDLIVLCATHHSQFHGKNGAV